jgi:hypothetical protein
LGACCFENGDCQMTNPQECSASGGLYKGTGTVCEPNPCCVPPNT